MHDIKKKTKIILKKEANAILDLTHHIDDNFEKAIYVIHNCPGKVVFTGIGKSGHIAKKIAATFSSLGTPSFFMHPAEGVHGDLGMIGKNDLVIAISNSGETKEILNLIPSLKKMGVKLISITGDLDSTLAQHSDVALNIGKQREVDPLGFAPTTSTTVSLALGDALAVILSILKNFTEERFGTFHPGGALGEKILKSTQK